MLGGKNSAECSLVKMVIKEGKSYLDRVHKVNRAFDGNTVSKKIWKQ